MQTWSPIQKACHGLLEDLSEIARAVMTLIRATVPAYAAVPEGEHLAGVTEQLAIRLRALADDRPLLEADLAAAAALAEIRAAEGLPVDSLIAAYQIGDQEIWRLLTEWAGSEISELMPHLGERMFAATTSTSAAMARAHTRVARDIDGSRIAMAHRFLSLLGDPAAHGEAALVATRLGLDPNGTFVGFVWDRSPEPPEVQGEAPLPRRTGAVEILSRAIGDGRLELVAQGGDPERLADLVAGSVDSGRMGVGLPRLGVAGAAMSVDDAAIALSATDPERTVVRFEDDWVEALVRAEHERILPIIQRALYIAVAKPHLADTVLLFADADMSIAKTAHAIHLHANSVTYRLDRWADLTGMNPRTLDGLVQSVIVCRQARMTRALVEGS